MNALHVLNAGRHLTPALEADVRRIAHAALDRHARLLGLDGVDVAVWVSPWGLPETGIHGYALLDHLVQLTVNPENPNFAGTWRTELPATVAHELHHARRWHGPGYGHTLLEVLVSEGLAQWHEHTERGGPPPYAVADVDRAALWARAVPLLDTTDFGFEAWFYGCAGQELPRWAGYTLGYDLVGRALAALGGTAADHVHTPAGAFRMAAGS